MTPEKDKWIEEKAADFISIFTVRAVGERAEINGDPTDILDFLRAALSEAWEAAQNESDISWSEAVQKALDEYKAELATKISSWLKKNRRLLGRLHDRLG